MSTEIDTAAKGLRRIWPRPLALAMLLVCLTAARCPAQTKREQSHSGSFGGPQKPQDNAEEAVLLISTYLHLSDTQQQQFRGQLIAEVKMAIPMNTQLEAAKKALFEGLAAGKPNDELQKLAAQENSVTAQMLNLQDQSLLNLMTLLHSNQKKLVDRSIYSELGDVLSGGAVEPPAPQ